MSDYLYLISHEFKLGVNAFVLMSNHFHLLATPSDDRISAAILYFMRETSKEITKHSGRINQTYGARNYKTLIYGFHHFMNAYKYTYRNPVRAGICTRVEEYRYSTLHGLLGLSRMIIPVVEDSILFDPNLGEQNLLWLNKSPVREHEDEIRRALGRSIFELKADSITRKKSELEYKLI